MILNVYSELYNNYLTGLLAVFTNFYSFFGEQFGNIYCVFSVLITEFFTYSNSLVIFNQMFLSRILRFQ